MIANPPAGCLILKRTEVQADDDLTMTRVCAALVAGAAIVVLAGCGGSSPTSNGYSADGVRAAMYSLLANLQSGDVAATCADFVPEDRATCAQLIPAVHPYLTDAVMTKARAQVQSRQIVISGGRATFVNTKGVTEEAVFSNGRWLFRWTKGATAAETTEAPSTQQGAASPTEAPSTQQGSTGPTETPQPAAQPESAGALEARPIKVQVRTMQTAMETYATDHNGSYVGATVHEMEVIEPTLGEQRAATPSVLATAQNTYEISSTGASGEVFKIARLASGEPSRTCEPVGQRGCPETGMW